MIVYLLLLAIVSSSGMRVVRWNEQYVGRYQTTCIKGFFIILVILNHANGYLIRSGNTFDLLYFFITSHIGQLMVVMFLFYSGYGIMESYKKSDKYPRCFLEIEYLKHICTLY